MPALQKQLRRAPSVALLAAAILGLPVARGGASSYAELAGCILVLAALVAASWREARVPALPLVLLWGVLGMVGAQLLPLPPPVHRISPGAVSVFSVSLAPLNLYPSWRPLSLDLAATSSAFARWSAVLAAATVASTIAGSERSRQSLVRVLAVSGGIVALTVLGAYVVDLGPLTRPVFPFVNPNHLAGFANLTAFTALGLAFSRQFERSTHRAFWVSCFVAGSLLTVSSLSRAGIGSYVLGGILFLALQFQRLRGARASSARTPGTQRWAVLVVGVGIALVAAVVPTMDRFRAAFVRTDELKYNLWPIAMQVLRDHPLTGVGAGAFSSAFDRFRTEAVAVTFTHLENEWLQPLLDLGVPAGLAVVVCWAWMWIGAAVRPEPRASDIGLLAGTAAVAAQNLFDFSLEILGVAVPFAVAIGLLSRRERGNSLPSIAARGVTLAVGAAALAASAAGIIRSADRDVARILSERTRPPDLEAAARLAAEIHPADYLPHAAAGARLVSANECAAAMPWLLRAMTLNPVAARPHLDAARCLLASGQPDLAHREFRLAIAYGDPAALARVVRSLEAWEDLAASVPDTPGALVDLGYELRRQGRPRVARRAFTRAYEEFADEAALIPLAQTTLDLGDAAEALRLARLRTTRAPLDVEAYRIAAWSHFVTRAPALARAEAERGLRIVPGSLPLLSIQAEVALSDRHFSAAKLLAERIVPQNAAERAAKDLLIARALAAQGRTREAIEYVRDAADAQPDSPEPLLRLASLCEQSGQLEDAISALERASSLPGVPANAYRSAIERLQAARLSMTRSSSDP